MAKATGPTGELETQIERLYQLPLDQFTEERNALATTLKKGGDAAAAARVKALNKPTATAWAVNQVWWQQRPLFEALLEAGAAQRKAHLAFTQGRKADVRAAGESRREAVAAVTEAALSILGGDKRVAPDMQFRIAGTLEGLASSGFPEGETPGRLTRDVQSSGLDALTALAAAAAGAPPRPTIVARGKPRDAEADAAPASEPSERTASRPTTRPTAVKDTPGTAKRSAAERAREEKARFAAEAAEQARAKQLAEAQARTESLDAALAAATAAAEDAVAAEAEARQALESAAEARAALETQLDEARSAEAAARRALSAATTAASQAEHDRVRTARDADRAREALERVQRGKSGGKTNLVT